MLIPKTNNNTDKPVALDSPPPPFDQDPMILKLFRLMKANRNVLLIGGHGIGKTSIIMQLAKWQGLRLKYLSAATMDPYADLAGIPVVNSEKKMVEFIHDSDLDKYDIFFIDEINRPSHSKVLNGLLELVQFLSVQGRKFKRLKACWAGMNPPGMNYNVDDIDPTLMDRFHHYFELPSIYSLAFFENRFGIAMGRILVQWALDLSEDKRKTITPRRLEYIGESIMLFDNSSDMAASSVMSGTLSPSDFKILTMRLAPVFGTVDKSQTKAGVKIKGLVATQQDLNQDALARAIAQAQGEKDNGH